MLKYFITSKIKRKLLKLFLTGAQQRYYVREIEKLTHEPINGIRRELHSLEKAGFLKSSSEGNLKYFEANKNFPFYRELKTIIYATIGLGDYLRARLKDSEKIELAFIYGSVAKDEETVRSDVDLLVVGEVEERKLHQVLSKVEKETKRDINYTLMTKEEFIRRVRKDDPFLKRVLREKKIVLKGRLDVTGKSS